MEKAAVIIDNRDGLETVIEAHQRFLPKDWNVLWVNNEDTSTIFGYNQLLTSKRFWRKMPEIVLIFQHDSMLLKPGIEEFINYDFIGANIKHMPGFMNGGLSIRNSREMLKVINRFQWNGDNEDIYFVKGLRQLGCKLPDEATADRFSVETKFKLGSLGYHAIDKWLNEEQCKKIKNQYL